MPRGCGSLHQEAQLGGWPPLPLSSPISLYQLFLIQVHPANSTRHLLWTRHRARHWDINNEQRKERERKQKRSLHVYGLKYCWFVKFGSDNTFVSHIAALFESWSQFSLIPYPVLLPFHGRGFS